MSANRRKRQDQANRMYSQYMQGGFYTRDSEARALDYAPIPEVYEPRPARRTEPSRKVAYVKPKPEKKGKEKRAKRKKLRGTQTRYVTDYVQVEKAPFSFVMLFMVLFIGVALNLVFYAYVTQQEMQLEKIEKEIQTTKEEIIYRQAEVDAVLDIENVANIAKNRLGMDVPKSYQVVEIDMQQKSYFTQKDEPKKNNSFLLGIENFIKEIKKSKS